MLEEATVDVAGVTTLIFGDNVTEPYGSHLLELAVADGTGKVSEGGLNVGDVEAVTNQYSAAFSGARLRYKPAEAPLLGHC
jgi:hypothetical protein